MKNTLSPELIQNYRTKIRNLSNKGQYDKAYDLASDLNKKYPDILLFAYLEAVYTAEERQGFSTAQINSRYRLAASKLKKLLFKLKNVDPNLKRSIRNEYYWFSKQPYKQYMLGIEYVKNGDLLAHYSQGVGAVEVAKKYAMKGQRKLALRWAKKSEEAWLEYFKVQPNWFNSYIFYGKALGYQGKLLEMNKAFKKASKISGIPINNEKFKYYEADVLMVLKSIKS